VEDLVEAWLAMLQDKQVPDFQSLQTERIIRRRNHYLQGTESTRKKSVLY